MWLASKSHARPGPPWPTLAHPGPPWPTVVHHGPPRPTHHSVSHYCLHYGHTQKAFQTSSGPALTPFTALFYPQDAAKPPRRHAATPEGAASRPAALASIVYRQLQLTFLQLDPLFPPRVVDSPLLLPLAARPLCSGHEWRVPPRPVGSRQRGAAHHKACRRSDHAHLWPWGLEAHTL